MSKIFASWDLVRRTGMVISMITPMGTQVFIAFSLCLLSIHSEKDLRLVNAVWQNTST